MAIIHLPLWSTAHEQAQTGGILYIDAVSSGQTARHHTRGNTCASSVSGTAVSRCSSETVRGSRNTTIVHRHRSRENSVRTPQTRTQISAAGSAGTLAPFQGLNCSSTECFDMHRSSVSSVFGLDRLRLKTQTLTWRKATSANTLDNCISTPRAMHFACKREIEAFENTGTINALQRS